MFRFRLQRTDGSPADPPELHTAVGSWRQGDTVPLGRDRTLRALGVRDDDDGRPPILLVEDMPGSASGAAG